MQGICERMDISPWFWHYSFQNFHYCLLTSLTINYAKQRIYFLHQLFKRDYHFKHIENLRFVNTYLFAYYFPPICNGIWWSIPFHSFQILWRSCRHDMKVSIPPLIVGHRSHTCRCSRLSQIGSASGLLRYPEGKKIAERKHGCVLLYRMILKYDILQIMKVANLPRFHSSSSVRRIAWSPTTKPCPINITIGKSISKFMSRNSQRISETSFSFMYKENIVISIY